METTPIPVPHPGNSPSAQFRVLLVDAMRYWEPRRLVYNLALTAVTFAWLAATWPHFRPALSLAFLAPLSMLALFANLCYCAAYIVDIPMQFSFFAAVWRTRRWALWALGTLLAVVLANYWIADEIYPDFH